MADLFGLGKALLGAAVGFLLPPARRRLAERSAGRSNLAVDHDYLRSELATTLSRIANFQQEDAWWRGLLRTAQHEFVAPDFLKAPSRQEWLKQAEVQRDLLHLAEMRALGGGEDDDSATTRLAAAYQAATGEAANLALGAIEVVLQMMIAGYRASLTAGGSQIALTGVVQSAHGANLQGHAATQAQLAEIRALLEARTTELRSRGGLDAFDLATAFSINTAAARVRPVITGVGLVARPELPALLSAVAVQPTLLTGRGGAGKSGLVSLLVDELQAASQSVLLIDAGILPRSASTPSDVGQSLVEPLAIHEAISIVAQGQHVTFIVDQLDSIAGTDRCNAVIQLLRAASSIPNVSVLAVSRSFQAERTAEIADLGFERFDADELTESRAREALRQLGVMDPQQPLTRLAQNLLDLSLIASLVRKGVNIVPIAGEIALWDAYRLSVEREHSAALGRACDLAWRAAEQGSHSIPPGLVGIDDALAALESRGVLDATTARYRFRHERIRDYLVAWDAARQPDPLGHLVGRLPREVLLGALRWLHALLHSSDAEAEADLVNVALGDNALAFDVRAVVLEGLKSQTDPHLIVARALVPHLAHAGHSRLFFDDLDAAWLEPLEQSGAFASTPTMPGDYWPPIGYLKAQAPIQADAVTRILEAVHVGSSWIIGDILEIATKLPLTLAARVAEAMAVAIPEARLRQVHTSRTAARLAAELATGGHVSSALALVRALLEPFPGGRAPITDRPEVRTPLDVHESRDLLRIALKALLDADSSATRDVFERLLDRALAIDPSDNGSHSYIRRPAVEDTDRPDFGGNEGVLLVGLRDSAERWCSDHTDEACGLIRRYLAHGHWLFRRLGLHLLRLTAVTCADVVEEVLQDHQWLSATPVHHEMYRLLEATFERASPETQIAYLDWVERTVAESDLETYPAEQRERRRLGLTRRHLWPVREHLKGRWRERLDSIVSEYGAPDPDLQGYTIGPARAGWVGADTTEADARLRNLSEEELIEALLSFSSRNDPQEPGDIATAFGRLAQADPNGIGAAAERFVEAGLHPRLISELLRGLANAVRSATAIPWEPVIRACSLVAACIDNEPAMGLGQGEKMAWQDAQRDAIDLIDLGLRTNAPAELPHEQEQLACDVLIALLVHPDPGPERDSENDPLSVAINSARGTAIGGLITYAARRAARLKLPRGERLEPNVRAALDRYVDPLNESSAAVHSMFGWHFQDLLFLDDGWVRSHVDRIFPGDETLAPHWEAAWSSYLLNTPVYAEWYTNLDQHYRRGIEELAGPDGEDGHYLRDARARLVQSVLLAYLEGWEPLDDPSGRLALLVRVAPEDMLAVAFGFVGGELVRRKGPAKSNIWQRVRSYWESRVTDTESRNAVTKEFAPLWRLLPGVPVPLSEVTELIERTIARTTLGWEINQIIEYLAASADHFPRESARLLAALEAQVSFELRSAFHMGETQKILNSALQSGDAQAAEFARQFIVQLADKGDPSFYPLLQQYQN